MWQSWPSLQGDFKAASLTLFTIVAVALSTGSAFVLFPLSALTITGGIGSTSPVLVAFAAPDAPDEPSSSSVHGLPSVLLLPAVATFTFMQPGSRCAGSTSAPAAPAAPDSPRATRLDRTALKAVPSAGKLIPDAPAPRPALLVITSCSYAMWWCVESVPELVITLGTYAATFAMWTGSFEATGAAAAAAATAAAEARFVAKRAAALPVPSVDFFIPYRSAARSAMCLMRAGPPRNPPTPFVPATTWSFGEPVVWLTEACPGLDSGH